jgi:hypothetical protein
MGNSITQSSYSKSKAGKKKGLAVMLTLLFFLILGGILVHGARSVLCHTVGKVERASTWLAKLAGRRNPNVACVAQANKTARIVWALMFHERDFHSDFSAGRQI